MPRNIHLDNVKFALITLVVFGHLIEKIAMPGLKDIYASIYLFHIPAFVFVGGFLSRLPFSARSFLELVSALVIFQLLYTLPLSIAAGQYVTGILQPYWILWFLFSLIVWRAVLPLFDKARYPVLIGVLLAVAAGFAPFIGYPLSLSRSLVFLPFFLAGFFHGKTLLGFGEKTPLPLKIGAGILILALPLALHFLQPDLRWLYGSFSYAAIGVEGAMAAASRAAHLAAAFAAMMLFFAAIPASKAFLKEGGRHTLAPYLLHGFFVLALNFALQPLQMAPVLAFLVLAAVAFAMTYLLSQDKVDAALKSLIHLPLPDRKT